MIIYLLLFSALPFKVLVLYFIADHVRPIRIQ